MREDEHLTRNPGAGPGRRPCPPHGPLMEDGPQAAEGGAHGLVCLGCGMRGSGPEDFGVHSGAGQEE